jgi:hypothetical protein
MLEWPNRTVLPQDDELIVQGIYAGWTWFGIVNPAAFVFNVVLPIRKALKTGRRIELQSPQMTG